LKYKKLILEKKERYQTSTPERKTLYGANRTKNTRLKISVL